MQMEIKINFYIKTINNKETNKILYQKEILVENKCESTFYIEVFSKSIFYDIPKKLIIIAILIAKLNPAAI